MASLRDRIARFANTTFGWAVITRIRKLQRKSQKLTRFAQRHRALGETEDFYAKITAEFADQEVRHGPFKGLRYGNLGSRGSMLLPKLLGSYENELHPFLETLADKSYEAVLDIGCAEGYYAVGLARLLPQTQVYAYDIEASSRASCKQLARINGVEDRLTIGAFCTPQTLKDFDFPARCLIISDCEGYEAQLFTDEVIPYLTRADLIIECHDEILGKDITQRLALAFAATHSATVIQTTADHRKALDLEFPELAGKPHQMRLYMVEEMRRETQNFLILQARDPARTAQERN